MEDDKSSTDFKVIPSDKLIDATKPIVFHVGCLGDRYWKWVNQPEPGKPRFFHSPIIEACSKTPWWVVPLLWIPVFTSVLCYSTWVLSVGSQSTVACILTGILAWQCLEYTIHRYAFHANLNSYWGITFHFLFHGCHHKYPMDAERLVFPPVPASLLVAAVYLLLTASLPLQAALPLFSGMGYGYVLYDCAHYAFHHSRRRLKWVPLLEELRRRHMHHHYCDHDSGYGISSKFIDVALGTSAKLRYSCARSSQVLTKLDVSTRAGSSIDPLAARTKYESGHVLTISSPDKLQSLIEEYDGKLVVLMCKSSHCKPCKAFMLKYHGLATRFPDYVFLDVIGDESPVTRKMMVDYKIKATPTFLLFRDGSLQETVSGTGSNKLLRSLLAQLKEGERGRDWIEEEEEEIQNE
ncbi:hypothetical protein CEUSTIGMA_g1332.t1 [Chlamydomonas eustigma]|uniref:Thioredoxin domain-containing protein n=1 Tax=Chlamydomonas eustigma TaxID=1157962 RepID=A0A250WT95_9CHLO|nr:hypothetical protein CEUSTIGMA_g1332.t1 [Chlamydomonas eustigma]|eukprot:GAX73882.1 hypothetical protein CEUSTIGMA_g1332.t1 [Chlamydomonas eustigma]